MDLGKLEDIYAYVIQLRAHNLTWVEVHRIIRTRYDLHHNGYGVPWYVADYERAAGISEKLPRSVDKSKGIRKAAREFYEAELERVEAEYARPLEGPPTAWDFGYNLASDQWLKQRNACNGADAARLLELSREFVRRAMPHREAARRCVEMLG